jgi:hypothetical protein
MNVHVFDTLLKDQFTVVSVNTTAKRKLFKALYAELTDMNARSNLHIIMKDMQSEGVSGVSDKTTLPNYHVENDVDASDILAAILTHEMYIKEKADLFPLLEEQLKDISRGRCPAGRATRLLQIWNLLC